MPAIGNDRQAWARILRRIARFCRSPDEADDLLQSAFAKMEEYRATAEVHNPAAFLVRTAANLQVDDRRKYWRENAARSSEDYLQVADRATPQDEVLANRERLKRVQEGLNRLPDRTRRIFLMRRIDGLRYKDIADQLGMSQSAVEKQVARAAQFLAEWTDGW